MSDDLFSLFFLDQHDRAELRLKGQIQSTEALLAEAQRRAASQAEIVATLVERTIALERYATRLSAMVGVMGQLLIEQGVLDAQRSSELVAQALARLEPAVPETEPARQASGGGPYRSSGTSRRAPAPEAPRATCDGCKSTVLASTTNVTERGTLCDRCFQAMEIEALEKANDA